ncbi:MAG: hypothetical protein JWL65_1052 [Gammaproteobacteria bacterium]|nr:hypothetical protein [Gammaproteobacteria bacterium]
MERSAVLIMQRALLLLALLLSAPLGAAGSQSVVLVVRADSAVVDLDPVSVRKLFLGVPVLVNGSPLHPIRNRSDTRLDQIFLQVIAAMSQSVYDRQILIGLNRHGWLRPLELDSSGSILDKLAMDPNAVTFMWQRDVARNPKIRVIRVLWTD